MSISKKLAGKILVLGVLLLVLAIGLPSIRGLRKTESRQYSDSTEPDFIDGNWKIALKRKLSRKEILILDSDTLSDKDQEEEVLQLLHFIGIKNTSNTFQHKKLGLIKIIEPNNLVKSKTISKELKPVLTQLITGKIVLAINASGTLVSVPKKPNTINNVKFTAIHNFAEKFYQNPNELLNISREAQIQVTQEIIDKKNILKIFPLKEEVNIAVAIPGKAVDSKVRASVGRGFKVFILKLLNKPSPSPTPSTLPTSSPSIAPSESSSATSSPVVTPTVPPEPSETITPTASTVPSVPESPTASGSSTVTPSTAPPTPSSSGTPSDALCAGAPYNPGSQGCCGPINAINYGPDVPAGSYYQIYELSTHDCCKSDNPTKYPFAMVHRKATGDDEGEFCCFASDNTLLGVEGVHDCCIREISPGVVRADLYYLESNDETGTEAQDCCSGISETGLLQGEVYIKNDADCCQPDNGNGGKAAVVYDSETSDCCILGEGEEDFLPDREKEGCCYSKDSTGSRTGVTYIKPGEQCCNIYDSSTDSEIGSVYDIDDYGCCDGGENNPSEKYLLSEKECCIGSVKDGDKTYYKETQACCDLDSENIQIYNDPPQLCCSKPDGTKEVREGPQCEPSSSSSPTTSETPTPGYGWNFNDDDTAFAKLAEPKNLKSKSKSAATILGVSFKFEHLLHSRQKNLRDIANNQMMSKLTTNSKNDS